MDICYPITLISVKTVQIQIRPKGLGPSSFQKLSADACTDPGSFVGGKGGGKGGGVSGLKFLTVITLFYREERGLQGSNLALTNF